MRSGLFGATIGVAFIATSANAGIGPPIAYAKWAGITQEIYLVNPDGSGLTKLHTTPKNMAVGNLDLKPGGGEIAFSQGGALKILTYNSAGQPTAPLRSISIPCAGNTYAAGKDYHTDGTLLVSVNCGDGRSLWKVAPGASTATHVLDASYVDFPRFLPGGTMFIYKTGISGIETERLWKDSWPPSGTPQLVGPTPVNPRVNVANTSNTAIISNSPNFKLVNVDSGVETPGCTQAKNVQYSPDDSKILYLNVNRRGSSDTLVIHNSDCSGALFRLTGSSSFGPTFDWRRE